MFYVFARKTNSVLASPTNKIVSSANEKKKKKLLNLASIESLNSSVNRICYVLKYKKKLQLDLTARQNDCK